MIPSLIGTLGAFICITSYFYLVEKERVDCTYFCLNILSSLLILFSLYFNFNIAAMLVQFFFIGVGFYGLWKLKYASNKQMRRKNVEEH